MCRIWPRELIPDENVVQAVEGKQLGEGMVERSEGNKQLVTQQPNRDDVRDPKPRSEGELSWVFTALTIGQGNITF